MKTKLIFTLALTFLCAANSFLSIARAQAPFGNAISLDGVSQYVSVPAAAGSALNSPFTVEAWVYPRTHSSWSRLMDFGNSTAYNNIVCALSSGTTGQPALYFFDGSGAIEGNVTSPTALPLNTWTHLAFTYDGTNGSIFINGNLATSGPMPAPSSATRTSNFIGESNLGDTYANAIFDEFRIWSVARTQAQINGNLSALLVGNEAGLMLYYKFDNTSGTVATNSAIANGAAYNGTLINSPAWVPGPIPPSSLVGNTSDAGAGSLRNAINNTPSGGFIYFAPNLSGQTITLTSGELLVTNNLTIDASALPGGVAISGNNSSRVFDVGSNVTVMLTALTIMNGHVVPGAPVIDDGGGILNQGTLTLNLCTLSGNFANGSGGGVENNGTLTVDSSTFSSNFANYTEGGAIRSLGLLTVNESTLFNNTASSGDGGGLSIQASGTAIVNQSTLAGNSSAYSGGGIRNRGNLTINSSTLSGNVANGPGSVWGGGGIYTDGTMTINNSIVAGNINLYHTNIDGNFTSTGVNLTSGNPLLSPLGNYGGPTLTMLPMTGSPAIDAGSDSVTNMFATDQRGYPRFWGEHVDIGADESEPALLGDANGDGIVSQAELDEVYANYLKTSPWLNMTNVAGLGGTNVSFSLSNSVLGAYSIQYSTNLVNWIYLGPATPRYLFTDTNAPALPQRFYRLSYP